MISSCVVYYSSIDDSHNQGVDDSIKDLHSTCPSEQIPENLEKGLPRGPRFSLSRFEFV